MHPEWTEARRKAARRNEAIRARNRFLKEHGEWLGLEWKEMELVPVPAVENTTTEDTKNGMATD